jgi:integrase-like protein
MLKDARKIIKDSWKEYNNERPQKRLKGMTPKQYEDKLNAVITPWQVVEKRGEVTTSKCAKDILHYPTNSLST